MAAGIPGIPVPEAQKQHESQAIPGHTAVSDSHPSYFNSHHSSHHRSPQVPEKSSSSKPISFSWIWTFLAPKNHAEFRRLQQRNTSRHIVKIDVFLDVSIHVGRGNKQNHMRR